MATTMGEVTLVLTLTLKQWRKWALRSSLLPWRCSNSFFRPFNVWESKQVDMWVSASRCVGKSETESYLRKSSWYPHSPPLQPQQYIAVLSKLGIAQKKYGQGWTMKYKVWCELWDWLMESTERAQSQGHSLCWFHPPSTPPKPSLGMTDKI